MRFSLVRALVAVCLLSFSSGSISCKAEPGVLKPEQREAMLRGAAAIEFECRGSSTDGDKLKLTGKTADLDRSVSGCGKRATYHYEVKAPTQPGIWVRVGDVQRADDVLVVDLDAGK